MVNYIYDVNDEYFKRADNRGRPLYLNVTEALRIVNMIDMGNSIPAIVNKVNLVHPSATTTTIKSFIRNYNEGNIEIPTNAPVPSNVFDEMTVESNYDALERRVSALEEMMENKSVTGKVKSWLKK